MLVTAAERRQGLAKWLLRRWVATICWRANSVPVGDATPAGRSVYIGLGFQDHWTLQRLMSPAVRSMPAAGAGWATMRPIEAGDWPRLITFDAAVFGTIAVIYCNAWRRDSTMRR